MHLLEIWLPSFTQRLVVSNAFKNGHDFGLNNGQNRDSPKYMPNLALACLKTLVWLYWWILFLVRILSGLSFQEGTTHKFPVIIICAELQTIRSAVISCVITGCDFVGYLWCQVHVIVMCFSYYNQPSSEVQILSHIDLSILIIFTAELFLKLIAYSYRYFKSAWNLLDFIVVIISIVGKWFYQHEQPPHVHYSCWFSF